MLHKGLKQVSSFLTVVFFKKKAIIDHVTLEVRTDVVDKGNVSDVNW